MQIRVLGLAPVVLSLLALPAIAMADTAQDLTVHLSMSCPYNINICDVLPYEGSPGNPAAGSANFNSIDMPWTFDFVTADPISWNCDRHCNNYSADFAVGGTFLMHGPDGLTFTGEITSGNAWKNLDLTYGTKLSFSGEWSNGLTAYGNFLDQVTGWNGPYASLDVYTTPEPASLALVGGGMLAVWGARKRIL